ncbi:TPA: hypothetical protein DIU27_02025 [Candidatus Collierbacteria bacterium]|uniref:Transposase IS200-like domain-containing protein n=1 Tax=Candidatus Collierbacteria bacterium GW2011_GWB2_44_22 TaxID=1618387 RepID=A0A0G1KVS4_9BACT|nr:MAG: hypothetical protein UW31_C0009G0003 [Candidatus Collierbacteria bacterium GW2011_GWA2_44_13]KKT52024.1 MAG: hypothetical protein UW44_C0005G0066 [Candidatus Collierbacteria bacterium GW2011_GWB2_44_22]KKT62118.1 MAG: hypothetical protein UW56_C0011G0003 [Candidatus Collierbacteria bacterium GW2011_GWD1_44_27]KKT66688.1 MAG: hypothetical protein UW58_C0004G0037 [Candidatus Collierbacteria bacterium GW2011_GWC2_44_30]KKT69379.1 MAG: hypothetical protein UW64_C0001G0025 [Microgenomates gr
MPAKNVIKEYEAGGYYHIYNRGVDKRTIFEDYKDYKTFLSYLQLYLDPPLQNQSEFDLRGLSPQVKVSPSKVLKNYWGDIRLLAYCLMPNHFHLMIQQKSEKGIDNFMRSLSTKYVRYFNTRYKRIGPLFQGIYKAVKISDEYQFVYLSKYIHRNPLGLLTCEDNPRRLSEYKFSSYGNYLHLFSQTWINTSEILELFSIWNKSSSYSSFVEDGNTDDIAIIAPLTIDIL